MIDDIDYQNWLHQTSTSDSQAERRMANVWSLVESLKHTVNKDEDEETSIEDAIAKLVLRDLLERQEAEDDSDRVQIMTLHAAKGLEFPHVFLMGLEEEILPHRNSIDQGTVEEERRLMYVGITRARKTLTITYAKKRKQFGEIIESTTSRFLEELPTDDIIWEGRNKEPEAVSQQRGTATLTNLKALFDDDAL